MAKGEQRSNKEKKKPKKDKPKAAEAASPFAPSKGDGAGGKAKPKG